MKRIGQGSWWVVMMAVVWGFWAPAWAVEATRPAMKSAEEDRRAFEQGVDLARLRTLVIMHEDQIKILDSWARQVVSTITHQQSFGGHDPVYVALDMAFRPQAWAKENIVYVRDVPLRRQLEPLLEDRAEQARFGRQGRVSPLFIMRDDVQMLLQQESDVHLSRSAGLVYEALETFGSLPESLTVVPPAVGGARGQADTLWHTPVELTGNWPRSAIRPDGGRFGPLPGYGEEISRKIPEGFLKLRNGWQRNDVREANEGIAVLAEMLPTVNPGAYRTPAARTAELWYNRSFNGTIAALIYFLAMTLFVHAGVAGSARVHKAAMVVFSLAVATHLAAMGVRWWLAGRIPIQNQFESVLGAALFGCVFGWVLEFWRKNNLYGGATAFVGAIAMTVCYVFPFVIGARMGAEIATVAGILGHNIWLYIHVNIIIFSYILIAVSCVLGAAYLATQLWHWLHPLAADSAAAEEIAGRRRVLEGIDTANMVVLQMAFWMLGAGIICGAIWADVSWGRPWGWDAKETFALVTWIVYLIIVHVRFVLPRQKGTVMAWLSIVGFAVMMFNWIGVNFFLVGLHSYA